MNDQYPTIEEVRKRKKRVKLNSWVSLDLKNSIDAKLEPYAGTMSGLIRNLLTEWDRRTPTPDPG